jgi:hypothetical protein
MKLHDLIDLDVELLVKYMRDSGISHIRYHDVELTLGSPAHKEEPLLSGENWETEKDLVCACGHQSWEHNSIGECLHGCTDECKKIKEETR